MKKVKITKEQYNRLFTANLTESTDLKGGINRVDKNFKKAFANSGVENLSEEPFDIKAPLAGVPNSKMKMKKEPEALDESIVSPELHQAVSELIHNIYLNPSQAGLSTFFKQHGITWGDLITYLTSVGIIGAAGGGGYKLLNVFKTKFSHKPEVAQHQKEQDIEKIVDKVAKDPKFRVNIKASDDPSLGNNEWEYQPKYNPNRFKPFTSTPKDDYDKLNPYMSDGEVDETSQINQDESIGVQTFKPVGINKEIALLNGPDGLYVFDYAEIDGGNSQLQLNDIAQYVNDNINSISKGGGLQDFEKGVELVKMDEHLREELANIYSNDKEFVHLLNRVEEMTGAASSGAFTGPIGGSGASPKIDKKNTPANALISDEEEFLGGKAIDETTMAGGASSTPQSSPSGQYTQPAIWAKNKKNWKGAAKPQYPNGKIVGKEVNSNDDISIYETIAKKTGRSIEDVKKLIEGKVLKNKPL